MASLHSFVFVVLLSAFSVTTAHSEEFVLEKRNSHYRPVESRKSFRLPGTDIVLGPYKYLDENGDDVSRLGFEIKGQFYYVDEESFPIGDLKYGYSNSGYLVIDGWCGTGAHNRRMYLFKYGKNSIKLLDVINEAYGRHNRYSMDFLAQYSGNPLSGSLVGKQPPVWSIDDLDGNGKPDVRVEIYTGDRSPPSFDLFLEIRKDRLRVNTNPALYKPLFLKAKRVSPKGRPISYYVYGFLSQRLSLSVIRKDVRGTKSAAFILSLLEGVKRWDAEFHDRGGDKSVLVEYRLR